MSDAITAQVLDNLKVSGIVAHSIWSQNNTEGETTAIEIRFDNSEHPIIHIPAQNIVYEFEILKHKTINLQSNRCTQKLIQSYIKKSLVENLLTCQTL